MWLFDEQIYHLMKKTSPPNIVMDRGMAIHKMIRLLVSSLGGEAYLNFMGNEWGHPEWIDFPREGNGFSYTHSRRRWDLCDDESLRYSFLKQWDIEMNKLEEKFHWLSSKHQYISLTHEEDKLIVYEKGDLLFVFNFHVSKSFENYRIGT